VGEVRAWLVQNPQWSAAKADGLDRARLLELRPREARPVLENLGELIKLFAELRPPKSPFGRAMTSATN